MAAMLAASGWFQKRSPVDSDASSRASRGGTRRSRCGGAARGALRGAWGRTTVARAEMLHRIADGISARFDELLALEVADTGKPVALARQLDIPRGAANSHRPSPTSSGASPPRLSRRARPMAAGALNYALRKPVGVVAVVCPWNLPLLLATWKVAPALACGDTVVVKPSEETPQTAALLGEVMNEAGVPKGVYNVVHGFGPDSHGELLTTHRGVECASPSRARRAPALRSCAPRRPARAPCHSSSAERIPRSSSPIATFDGSDRRHAALVFRELRTGLSRHRARVRGAAAIRSASSRRSRRPPRRCSHGRPEDAATRIGPLISEEHRRKVLAYYQRARAMMVPAS